jgi:hypothetical protein
MGNGKKGLENRRTLGHSRSSMADLAKKLGIKSGHVVCLLNAPREAVALLRQECPEDVSFSDTLEQGPYDVILFWPTQLAGLSARFAQLQRRIVPDGAIWAVIPKKPFARTRGIDFGWSDVQGAALQTDLVDNKVATLSEKEYATRFVIRKDRRGNYAAHE